MIIQRHTYLRGRALVNARNELVSVTVDATSGNWTLTYGGQTTGNLAFNISVADLKTAVDGLSSVTAGDINYSGGPGDNGGNTPYYFAFASEVDESAITVADISLAGGGDTVTVAVILTGGSDRSIKYSHVPTANGRIQALELVTFFNKYGHTIEVHPLFLHNQDDDGYIYVNVNRGSSTPTASDYDIRVKFGTRVDLTDGVVAVRNISMFFDTNFPEKIIPGTGWKLTAWDPSMHIYDT